MADHVSITSLSPDQHSPVSSASAPGKTIIKLNSDDCLVKAIPVKCTSVDSDQEESEVKTAVTVNGTSSTSSADLQQRSSVSSVSSVESSCNGGVTTIKKPVRRQLPSLAAATATLPRDRQLFRQLSQQQLMTAKAAQLNQAIAIVTNRWDREQKRQEQDLTRKLTVLRQRKISAVLKVRKCKQNCIGIRLQTLKGYMNFSFFFPIVNFLQK